MSRRNEEVGALFDEHADLLAITGSDPFKIRAYQKAGRAVGSYHTDVGLLDVKQLCRIPNVGRAIAEKIVEYVRTGRVRAVEDARAKIPPGLRELTTVPTLGPRKAMQLHELLGGGCGRRSATSTSSPRPRTPARSWRRSLQYFTGSREHNVRVRELAVRAGLRLNEYGLFDAGTGEVLASETEEQVYAGLGMAWVPPALRRGPRRGRGGAARRVAGPGDRGRHQGRPAHPHRPHRRGVAADRDARRRRGPRLLLLRGHRPRAEPVHAADDRREDAAPARRDPCP